MDAHAHHHHHHGPPAGAADARRLAIALALILAFMVVEVVAALLSHSLALLSDAAHMLTDAAALGLALGAARLARRPPGGAMTYGLGRVEIMSAQINGVALLVLGLLIVYGAISRLASPAHVHATAVLVVALAGIPVNLAAASVLAGGARRSLNVEGSYRHVVTDLYAFIATAIAAVVILATGFQRADALASLLVALLMLHAAYGLLRATGRVFLEAAPQGIDPQKVGGALASQEGVVQVHDLHVWEVTSGFPALSAHVVARAGDDCHELRRRLQLMLEERFDLRHTTLQVDHEAGEQPLLRIETGPRETEA